MAPFSSPLKSPPHSLRLLSFKPRSSFKLKTLFQTLIFPHLLRIARPAAAKAKLLFLKLLRHTRLAEFPPLKKIYIKHKKQTKKVFFGSFRLHYNWCSSHVMPLGQNSISCPNSDVYHDSCCRNISVLDCDDEQVKEPDELSRYLEWLEDKGSQEFNEIDKLADLFIANCHEKFRLEKQESYRRFQEMMARSV